MRVLLAHNFYQYPGGEDVVFESEAALLRQAGDEVLQYTDSNDRISSSLAAAREMVWSTHHHARLGQALAGFRPDVVHFHNTFPLISPSAYHACRQAGVPVVQTLHNYRLLCPAATFYRRGQICLDCLTSRSLLPGVLHGCYRRSRLQTAGVAAMLGLHRRLRTWQTSVQVYIALNEFGRRLFERGGLPPERLTVKPNFVSDPGARTDWHGAYALFVGRLTEEKGVPQLMQAWRDLPVPLKVAGQGPLEGMVRAAAQHNAHIEYVGQLEHASLLDVLRQARFLISAPEWYEPFGLTLIEAFACGVPVIAPQLGGVPEIVSHGESGLLYPPGDAAALAAAALALWQDASGAARMGRHARQAYAARYTPAENQRQLREIYRHAMHAFQS